MSLFEAESIMIDGHMGEPAKQSPQIVSLLGERSVRPDPSMDNSPEQFRKVFAATLRSILDRQGFSSATSRAADELSERMNHRVSSHGILKWLSAERMPDAPTLVELSLILRESVDYMLRGDETLRRQTNDGLNETAAERAEKLQLVDQLVMLPKTAIYDPTTSEKKIVALSRSWIAEKFPGVMLQDIDKMRVQGDHMDPAIRQGDEVLYWTAPRFFEDNSVYVLQVGHNRMLRRIRQLVTGEFEISCENTRYPSERVPADTFPHPLNLPGAGSLRVVGKILAVIAFGR